MAVTYDDSLSTDKDKIRFHIQDTASDAGPKPDDSNFTDNELAGLVTAEGSWQKAVAACFEILQGLYAREVDVAVGPRRESLGQTAQRYQELAATWRERYGSEGGRATATHMTRIDGYSDDVAYDD